MNEKNILIGTVCFGFAFMIFGFNEANNTLNK